MTPSSPPDASPSPVPSTPTPSHGQGLLLFAHGARDPLWARPFDEVARQAGAARPGLRVRLAFLEFMEPDLPAAGAALAADGCTLVDVVPLFLGAGGHVRKDLPRLMDALRAAHPQVRWRLHRAVGEAAPVIAAMAAAALAPEPVVDDAQEPPQPAGAPAP